MNIQAEKKLGELVAELREDRAVLHQLNEILPILIAAQANITRRLDIHDEIMRLCVAEDAA